MILTIFKTFNSVIGIGFFVYGIYCFYKFCVGEKTNSETLWYGIFALIVYKLILGR